MYTNGGLCIYFSRKLIKYVVQIRWYFDLPMLPKTDEDVPEKDFSFMIGTVQKIRKVQPGVISIDFRTFHVSPLMKVHIM